MKARVAFALAVVTSTVAACSAVFDRSDEGPSNFDDEALARVGTEGREGRESFDAGVKDTGVKDTGAKDTSTGGFGALLNGPVTMLDPTPSCPPERWDVVVASGTCAGLSKTTSAGVWSATSLYPGVSDKHCALTFRSSTASCAAGDPVATFSFGCPEKLSLTKRSAACAADPTACTGSGSAVTTTSATSPAFKPATDCGPFDGGSGGTGVAGCDSCGVIFGGSLFLTNPFPMHTVYVDLWHSGAGVVDNKETWLIHATPLSSFRMDLPPGSWADGHTAKVWWMSPMPDAGVP